MLAARRRLLLVHAHPDDETINNGASMALYAAQGAHVCLLTCTLGEFGEILVPELAELEWDKGDQLGGYRMGELAAAMSQLGVTDHRFLGGAGRFHDSGMMGTAGNGFPRAFWRAASDETVLADAVRSAVAVIRELQPQVVVTYDPNGGYGHPDHIMAHRVASAAVEAAADRHFDAAADVPWQVAKLYWNVVPRSVMEHSIEALRAAGTSFFGLDSVDDFPFVVDDAEVTTSVDASAYTPAKIAAMRAHATQIAVDGPFFALSNNLGMKVWGTEHYRLVQGRLGEQRDALGRETDLFAGVE